MIQAHEQAPEFSLSDDQGIVHTLSELKGNKVLIYFYPKDDTPGCTKEACSFRDNIEKFTAKGVAVFGISKDNEASHEKFKTKYHLNFPLLYDKNGDVAKAYGVLGLVGIARTTFLIGQDGTVEKVWEKVRPDGHSDEILRYLEGSK